MAEHRDLAMALDRVDLALQRLDVGNGREIEIFAPDIGNEPVEELFAQRQIAGDGARLDHRGALPVLAHAFVIDSRRLDRYGDLGRARIRPQPQIDAKDIAVLGHVLQQHDQALGEAHEEGRGIDAVGEPCGLGIVKDDEIDIARIVELMGTEFAHAEDGIARRLAGIVLIERRNLAGAQRLAQQPIERRLKSRLGKPRQGLGHLVERPFATDIGKRDRHRGPPLAHPQETAELRFIGHIGAKAGDELAQRLVGIALQAVGSKLRITQDEVAQEGRAAKDRIDERALGFEGGRRDAALPQLRPGAARPFEVQGRRQFPGRLNGLSRHGGGC